MFKMKVRWDKIWNNSNMFDIVAGIKEKCNKSNFLQVLGFGFSWHAVAFWSLDMI